MNDFAKKIIPKKDVVDLALKISKYIHDNCENVPHDIGMKIMEIVMDHGE